MIYGLCQGRNSRVCKIHDDPRLGPRWETWIREALFLVILDCTWSWDGRNLKRPLHAGKLLYLLLFLLASNERRDHAHAFLTLTDLFGVEDSLTL